MLSRRVSQTTDLMISIWYLALMKYERVCPVCETEFEANRIDNIYCSSTCQSKRNNRSQRGLPISDRERWGILFKRTCPVCEVDFETTDTTKRYCTKKHTRLAAARRRQKNPVSNTEFYKARKEKREGASYKTQNGYISKFVNGKYVYEHRHVMSKHLGRELVASETVHHKNGVRDDNRIENLELWPTNHPPGQRLDDRIQALIEELSLYGEVSFQQKAF